MKFVLAKNWGEHKEGSEVDLIDETVIEAGKNAGLFVERKKENKTKKEE
jgi:hypothetical protein